MALIFGRRKQQPSKEALNSIYASARELVEAKELHQESTRVGAALRQAHQENHFAVALAAAIAGRKPA